MKIRRLFQGILIGHTLVTARYTFYRAIDLVYELGMIEGTRIGVGLTVGLKKHGEAAYQGYLPNDVYIYAKTIFECLDEQENDVRKKIYNFKQGKYNCV